MVEKTFRVISDSPDHLEADVIAIALLKQITLDPKGPQARFVVIEQDRESSPCIGCRT